MSRPPSAIGLVPLLAASLAVCPTRAVSQIPGNVDWPVFPGGTGTTLAVDAAQGLNFDSGESLYLGARAVFNQSRTAIWIGGGYSGIDDPGDGLATGGAGFAFTLAECGSVTLSADGGVGATRSGGSWIWGVPAGLTLWINPTPASVVPFLRAHGIVTGGGGAGTNVGFAGVAGIEIRQSAGLGFHLAIQWDHIDQGDPFVVGGGVAFRL